MTLLASILFFIVFIQLFIALTLYLFITIRNYLRESKQQKPPEEKEES